MRPRWLTWFNPDNYEQRAWVARYLTARGFTDFGQPLGEAAFITAMERRENDMAFRYTVDKMRAAWRQRRYRKANGQQVAFQLPDQVRKDLSRLAKARGQTKVETLRQVISEAANQHEQEKKAVKKVREECRKLKIDHEKMATFYSNTINNLLETLAEELHQRSRMDALVGEWGNSTLDEESGPTYDALIAKRVAELEAAQPDLKRMRTGLSRFNQRLESLAGELGPRSASRPMQDREQEPPHQVAIDQARGDDKD